MSRKRILVVYYSFSSQTQLLIQRVVSGIQEHEVDVEVQRLHPKEPISFPFTSLVSMGKVMLFSFFQWRVPIQPVDQSVEQKWDLIILAGPTWSYCPSGPILDFLDTYGKVIVTDKDVMPIISCRSYWRTHYWWLKKILKSHGGKVLQPLIYQHTAKEPWRTIGLFLQIMGRMPRLETSKFRKNYPRYGHSKEQLNDAVEQGRRIAESLL